MVYKLNFKKAFSKTRDVGNYKIETFLILLLAKAGSMPCKLYQ